MNKQFKKMMAQAQQMQQNLLKIQEELAEARVEGSAAGGLVKATVSGQAELLDLQIDREAVDPEDLDLLADMIIAAVRDATEKSRELSTRRMQEMGIPTGMGGMM